MRGQGRNRCPRIPLFGGLSEPKKKPPRWRGLRSVSNCFDTELALYSAQARLKTGVGSVLMYDPFLFEERIDGSGQFRDCGCEGIESCVNCREAFFVCGEVSFHGVKSGIDGRENFANAWLFSGHTIEVKSKAGTKNVPRFAEAGKSDWLSRPSP